MASSRRIGRMTAKIEIMRKENMVRFWVYDGPLVRKLSPIDVPMSKFPQSDVDIPRDVSLSPMRSCLLAHDAPCRPQCSGLMFLMSVLFILNNRGHALETALV